MAASRQAPMISIPLKSTDDVEFITPLRQYIRGFYGSSEKFTEECAAINRMRQDMRGAGKDEMGRNLLYRYYGQLELLELRFPIDEEHVKISFHWYDAFTEVPTSQYSLAYEKACVLFNIAAILSFTASTQIRSEVEGMKKAFHSLQACAGLLNFINENFLHAPSTDLSRESVKTLSIIMLAQAQEVFTEKQIRNGGKNSIIAKLAAETANLYHNANESLTELAIAGTIDSIWGSFCQIKEKLYSALAQYHQAGFDEEKGKYGTSVTRLNVAQAVLKDALQIAKSHSGQFARYPYLSNDPGSALTEVLMSTIEIVNEKTTTVTKENDVIYHDTVPKESALSTIAKLVSAKPISLHDLYKGQDVARLIGHDIFHKLVPLSIHESASMYSEEIDKLLRGEQERSDIADTELTTTFDYLGLPKSLHQFKMSDTRMAQELSATPNSLHALAAVVAHGEAKETLASRLSSIKGARETISDTIARASKSLDEEARQCEAMRSKFFEIWTQEPSQTLNTHLRDDLRQYRNSLDVATRSDEKIQDEYRSVQREIEGLGSKDSGHMDSVFQGIVSRASNAGKNEHNSLLDLNEEEDDSNAVAISVDQVDDAMRKLNLVKKERLQTLQDLKEKARKDDISEVLILNKKTPEIEQRVFATELEKFNSHRTRISATISRQEQLLEEMTSTFTQVLENKKDQARQQRWAKASQDRASTIKAFEHAGKVYEDLSSGVMQAKKFYEELSRLTNILAEDVRSFVQQRQNEGRALLDRSTKQSVHKDPNSLREQLERMSLGSGSNSRYDRPAPPPPPPNQQYSRPY